MFLGYEQKLCTELNVMEKDCIKNSVLVQSYNTILYPSYIKLNKRRSQLNVHHIVTRHIDGEDIP